MPIISHSSQRRYFNQISSLQKILAGITPIPVAVEIVDNSDGLCDGGAKLEVLVVSEAFDKLPPLKRHRMVNDCLKDLMPQIHALSLKTYTPEQYENNR